MLEKDDENALVRDKWVRVMADFCANGIWEKSGCAASLSDLPVHPDTIFTLGAWQHWHDARKHDVPISNLEHFSALGRAIVWDIKRQLPDWTVIYHDEITGGDVVLGKLWLE